MRVLNDTLIPSGPQTLNSNWVSEAIPIGHLAMFSVQLVFSGTPSGSFYLECSNDVSETAPNNPNNWTLIDGSVQNVTEAGDHTWNVEDAAFNWIRVGWTFSGGTGSLNSARVNAKGV